MQRRKKTLHLIFLVQFWGHRDKEGLFTVIGIGRANTEKEADNSLVLYLEYFLNLLHLCLCCYRKVF